MALRRVQGYRADRLHRDGAAGGDALDLSVRVRSDPRLKVDSCGQGRLAAAASDRGGHGSAGGRRFVGGRYDCD